MRQEKKRSDLQKETEEGSSGRGDSTLLMVSES